MQEFSHGSQYNVNILVFLVNIVLYHWKTLKSITWVDLQEYLMTNDELPRTHVLEGSI